LRVQSNTDILVDKISGLSSFIFSQNLMIMLVNANKDFLILCIWLATTTLFSFEPVIRFWSIKVALKNKEEYGFIFIIKNKKINQDQRRETTITPIAVIAVHQRGSPGQSRYR